MKKIISFLIVALLILGVCAPVFATEENKIEEVEAVAVQEASSNSIGDYIFLGGALVIWAVLVFGASGVEYNPKGLTHSVFTPIGRANILAEKLQEKNHG